MRLKSAAVIAVCALSLGLAACEERHMPTGPGGVGTPAVTTDPMVDLQRGRQHFVATYDRINRTETDVHLDVNLPQVKVEGTGKGVNWPAGRAFNDGMLLGFWEHVDKIEGPAEVTDPNRISKVERIGTHVLSGVTYLSVDFHGAHPIDQLYSTVIDVDTAQALTMDTLFTDRQQGLTALAAQAKAQLARTRLAGVIRYDLVTASTTTFQVWTATPAGLHLYFPQGQIAPTVAGTIDVTVPWSDLKGVLKQGTLATLSS